MRDGKAVAEELALIEPESIPAGQTNERWRPMHWLPRLRIFRNPLEEFSFTQKRRGTFAHHCLACLQTAGQLTGTRKRWPAKPSSRACARSRAPDS